MCSACGRERCVRVHISGRIGKSMSVHKQTNTQKTRYTNIKIYKRTNICTYTYDIHTRQGHFHVVMLAPNLVLQFAVLSAWPTCGAFRRSTFGRDDRRWVPCSEARAKFLPTPLADIGPTSRSNGRLPSYSCRNTCLLNAVQCKGVLADSPRYWECPGG